jgi:hypothetical protein
LDTTDLDTNRRVGTPRVGRSSQVSGLAIRGWLLNPTRNCLRSNARYVALHTWRRYSDKLVRATFRCSIAYLARLFAARLVDHYL